MHLNKQNLDALFQAYNAAFREGLGMAPSDWEKLAMVIPSSTSENVYPWIGKLPGIREWLGDRVIENIAAYDYRIKNRTFELTVGVRREDVEDDQYGLYAPLFQDLGNQAAIHPNQMVFGALRDAETELCYDGQPFFSTAHPVGEIQVSNLLAPASNPGTAWYLINNRRPVKPIIFQRRRGYELHRMDRMDDENVFMRGEYIYGIDARLNVGYGFWQLAVKSTKPLNDENYAEARALMASYRNDVGTPLGLLPTILLVPPTLEADARRVVVAATLANGATNVWAGSAELVVSPWL